MMAYIMSLPCDEGNKNSTTVIPIVCKRRQETEWDIWEAPLLYSIQREGKEEGRVMSP